MPNSVLSGRPYQENNYGSVHTPNSRAWKKKDYTGNNTSQPRSVSLPTEDSMKELLGICIPPISHPHSHSPSHSKETNQKLYQSQHDMTNIPQLRPRPDPNRSFLAQPPLHALLSNPRLRFDLGKREWRCRRRQRTHQRRRLRNPQRDPQGSSRHPRSLSRTLSLWKSMVCVRAAP